MRIRLCKFLPSIWVGFVHIHLAYAINHSQTSTLNVFRSGSANPTNVATDAGSFTGSDVPNARYNSSASGSDVSVVGFRAADRNKGKGNETTKSITSSGTPKRPSLGGVIECYDPPTQREIGYPIIVKDCEQAAMQIIGERDKFDYYIFSRRKVKDPFYYPMPARYTHGNCVVSLDMEHPEDIERIRLTYVESSAWVLAHKCSGEEVPQQKYGGTMTVGVGANDLIRVYVYGLWTPTPSGLPLLSLSQNRSSVDSQ